MRDYFVDIETNVQRLPQALGRAVQMDQLEISLSLQAAAKLGLAGAAGAAFAAWAAAQVATATASATGALAQIMSGLAWISQSKTAPTRLYDRGNSWGMLNDDVIALGDQMVEIQRQGMSNEWTGEAKNRWQQFTDRQIEEHTMFQQAVAAIPGLLFEAKNTTEQLLIQFALSAKVAATASDAAAARALCPNPMGFGIATRTPQVAKHLMQCAQEFTQYQGGPWRAKAQIIAQQFAGSRMTMDASAAGGAG